MQTQIQLVLRVGNDLLKEDYTPLCCASAKGISHTVCNTLDKKYWEQLEAPVFLYKIVKLIYFTVNLDK